MCMLSCILGISFKASVVILKTYGHRFADIFIGHLFFAWITVDLDSSDNYIIILCFFLVSVYSCKHDPLSLAYTFCHPFVLFEYTIFGMICLHLETILLTNTLKGYFYLCSFIFCSCIMKICLGKPILIVHKYSSVLVFLYCCDLLYLGYKYRSWLYKLV